MTTKSTYRVTAVLEALWELADAGNPTTMAALGTALPELGGDQLTEAILALAADGTVELRPVPGGPVYLDVSGPPAAAQLALPGGSTRVAA